MQLRFHTLAFVLGCFLVFFVLLNSYSTEARALNGHKRKLGSFQSSSLRKRRQTLTDFELEEFKPDFNSAEEDNDVNEQKQEDEDEDNTFKRPYDSNAADASDQLNESESNSVNEQEEEDDDEDNTFKRPYDPNAADALDQLDESESNSFNEDEK